MAININKDALYRAAKAKDKDYTINDGGGLTLLVKSNESKLWRFIYRFNGKQNRLGLGSYPDTTLENARRQAEEARKQIATGIDPSQTRKTLKLNSKQIKLNADRANNGLPIINSFAHISQQWLDSIEHLNKPQTLVKKTSRISTHAYPALGDRPINEIKSSEILSAIKP